MDKAALKKYSGARVVVALSGGVDSSVAAALLAEAGCEVVGVTMKLWGFSDVGGNIHHEGRCCSAEAFDDARMVARRIDFPFYVIDLADDFRRTVIDDFITEYKAGRTPNPCVLCNTKIKWSVLEQRARMLGADFLATGHYARIQRENGNERPRLLRGVDRRRDQSYFLWGVPSDSLSHTIFPLGSLVKDDVRILARQLDLRNAERPESREICFIADDNYGRFLREKGGVTDTPGDIVNDSGQIVGRHMGVAFYTIGQRKRIGAHGTSAYVTALDATTNTVHIGTADQLLHHEFIVTDLNWISIDPPAEPFSARVQIRYRHSAAPAKVFPGDGGVRVVFDSPQRAITPGQSAVFYEGEVVLGGGRIKAIVK